jgi:membrane protein YdbS with pleckstrin-like domain
MTVERSPDPAAPPAGGEPARGGPAHTLSAEPARRLSPGARWVWAAHQALLWLVLLALAVAFGRRLWSPLWVPALAGLLTGPLGVSAIRWRRWRWDVGDDGIDIRHGTLTVRRTLIPWIRVQHVDTRRGVIEQLFHLATVVVHTAAGAHEIPLLDAREAEVLRARIGALARRDD